MNKLFYYFASKKLLMAQAKDLGRQLQEAWAENALLTFANETLIANAENMVDQLHRVARERFSERAHRLTIEQQYSNLQDEYLRLQQITVASVEDCHAERKLRMEAEKLRDVYLEQLENEEE